MSPESSCLLGVEGPIAGLAGKPIDRPVDMGVCRNCGLGFGHMAVDRIGHSLCCSYVGMSDPVFDHSFFDMIDRVFDHSFVGSCGLGTDHNSPDMCVRVFDHSLVGKCDPSFDRSFDDKCDPSFGRNFFDIVILGRGRDLDCSHR